MLRRLLTVCLVGGVWASVLSLAGCTDNSSPYSLTGAEAANRSRYIDQKGHYRPDLEMAGRPTN